MEPFHIIAILITLAAGFAYVNYHFIKMPMTIGLMLMSLVISVGLIIMDQLGLPVKHYTDQLVKSIDFKTVLMDGMLGLLLFAGALHVDLNDLSEKKLEISILATLGVVTSTVLVGFAVYGLSALLGLKMKLTVCLLFGALISPTDPIAVMGILKKAGAPKSLETKIAGESLFNDGFGVVVFMVLFEVATGHIQVTPGRVLFLFAAKVQASRVLGFLLRIRKGTTDRETRTAINGRIE